MTQRGSRSSDVSLTPPEGGSAGSGGSGGGGPSSLPLPPALAMAAAASRSGLHQGLAALAAVSRIAALVQQLSVTPTATAAEAAASLSGLRMLLHGLALDGQPCQPELVAWLSLQALRWLEHLKERPALLPQAQEQLLPVLLAALMASLQGASAGGGPPAALQHVWRRHWGSLQVGIVGFQL